MGAFAPMNLVKTLTEDIDDLITKEEFYKTCSEMEYMKKDFGKFITKEEIMTRISVLNSDLSTKL